MSGANSATPTPKTEGDKVFAGPGAAAGRAGLLQTFSKPFDPIPRMVGYYLIHSIDFREKINLTHEPSTGLFLDILLIMYFYPTMAGSHELVRRDPSRPAADIVAKDLNERPDYSHALLYHLPQSVGYSLSIHSKRNKSIRSTLNDGPGSQVRLRRPMMFGRVSAGWFSQLFSRPRSEGAGVVACASRRRSSCSLWRSPPTTQRSPISGAAFNWLRTPRPSPRRRRSRGSRMSQTTAMSAQLKLLVPSS